MYIYVQLCITNVANPQLSQTINLMLKSHHFFCSEFIFNITVSVNINIYFRNQKRVLEEKLRALEAEHAASKRGCINGPLWWNVDFLPLRQRNILFR
jgi:hypothetical protein